MGRAFDALSSRQAHSGSIGLSSDGQGDRSLDLVPNVRLRSAILQQQTNERIPKVVNTKLWYDSNNSLDNTYNVAIRLYGLALEPCE